MKLQDKWNFICMRTADIPINIDSMYDSLLGLLADTVDSVYDNEYPISIIRNDALHPAYISSLAYYTVQIRINFNGKDFLVIGVKCDIKTSQICSMAIGNRFGTIYSDESNIALCVKLLRDIIGYIISDPMKETWFILQGIKVRSWLEVLK